MEEIQSPELKQRLEKHLDVLKKDGARFGTTEKNEAFKKQLLEFLSKQCQFCLSGELCLYDM